VGVGAATGRLQHLVVGASALVDGAVAKPHGHISGELRDLKALELAVGAVLRDEGLGFFMTGAGRSGQFFSHRFSQPTRHPATVVAGPSRLAARFAWPPRFATGSCDRGRAGVVASVLGWGAAPICQEI
jgi:hypothetical protein